MPSVTIDLSENAYKILRASVDSGDFASESEAIEDIIVSLCLERIPEVGSPKWEAYEKRLREEVVAALEEFEANPDSGFTGEEVLAHIAEERAIRAK